MVDVGDKPVTARRARAQGRLSCSADTLALVEEGKAPKDRSLPGFIVEAVVRTEGRTGVEMEALTAVSVACLTLFDMLKAADKGMTIGEIRVTEKEGGASGDWQLPR